MVIMVNEVVKCINCGEINLVDEARKISEDETKEDWTIKTTITVRRKFKQICGRRGEDFNDGLLYLIGLDVREQHGMLETGFGVPGTGK